MSDTEMDSIFFFQAEDGIRDGTVTGVQTCALPISASGRPSKAAWSRASWPACRISNVPPRTTRIWRTILSTRYKNASWRQTALVNREEVRVQSEGRLSQRRLTLDDLQLPQHVRPHNERTRRAVDGEEWMVERDGF